MDTVSERSGTNNKLLSRVLSRVQALGFWGCVGVVGGWIWKVLCWWMRNGVRNGLTCAAVAIAMVLYVLPALPGAGESFTTAAQVPVNYVKEQYVSRADAELGVRATVMPVANELPSKEELYVDLRRSLCVPKGITEGCREHFDSSYKPDDPIGTLIDMRQSIEDFLERWTRSAPTRDLRHHRVPVVERSQPLST